MLNYKEITYNGISHLTGLTSLRLCCDSAMTGEDVQKFSNLTKLDLESNDGIQNYDIKHLTKLEQLGLCNNKVITDEVLPNFTNLTLLDLRKNEVITENLTTG